MAYNVFLNGSLHDNTNEIYTYSRTPGSTEDIYINNAQLGNYIRNFETELGLHEKFTPQQMIFTVI